MSIPSMFHYINYGEMAYSTGEFVKKVSGTRQL